MITSDNSSAGRAEDCRVCMVILRSLVQFQLVGFFYSYENIYNSKIILIFKTY